MLEEDELDVPNSPIFINTTDDFKNLRCGSMKAYLIVNPLTVLSS